MGARLLESKLRNYPRPYLTDAELAFLLDGTPDSRYGKVKRLLAQGKLLHIRRGLYSLTDVVGCKVKPHPYELAQYVYGPSYISLESALSFHRLIPEGVYTVTNATGKRSKEFHSSLGVFSYLHLPLENLFTGVELVNENGRQFFVAKPWKAICDYVFCYKKDWKGLEPLLENLRIDLDSLPMLRNEEIQLLDEYYQSARVSRFLKGVQRDLYHENSKVLVREG
ncbi:MAG: hypothetical protein A3F11_00765 [Gammaproteobacteria bacterium RIFCSPHIGHO2_12_FULL_37_14]|nr:MAG: hypothetical protein A3F11_00765 [Gammaproteobacteria bacterium RIFCSPHIGHO2_12_FULL_37_14]